MAPHGLPGGRLDSGLAVVEIIGLADHYRDSRLMLRTSLALALPSAAKLNQKLSLRSLNQVFVFHVSVSPVDHRDRLKQTLKL